MLDDAKEVADYVLTHLGLFLRGVNPIYAKNEQTLQKVIAKVKNYYNPGGRDNEIDVAVKVRICCKIIIIPNPSHTRILVAPQISSLGFF